MIAKLTNGIVIDINGNIVTIADKGEEPSHCNVNSDCTISFVLGDESADKGNSDPLEAFKSFQAKHPEMVESVTE